MCIHETTLRLQSPKDIISLLTKHHVDFSLLQRGPKNLHDLLEEARLGEVRLIERSGRLLLFRMSVHVSIDVLTPHGIFKWRQVAIKRPYCRAERKRQPYTFSGTKQFGETTIDTIRREGWEEAGLVFADDAFDFGSYAIYFDDEHPSSVYWGLTSYVLVEKINLELREDPWPGCKRKFTDIGKTTLVRRFSAAMA